MLGLGVFGGWGWASQHKYEVEAFTTDLTIRIQCSGDCDLAAMIAEAREAAAEK